MRLRVNLDVVGDYAYHGFVSSFLIEYIEKNGLNLCCKIPAMIIENSKRFNDDSEYNRVIFETANFKVIPSLGSLVAGWLLILPKTHVISIGAIKNDLLYSELQNLVDKVVAVVRENFGEPIVFEHGPIIEQSKVGCGVDYAHIHIVPFEISLSNVQSYCQAFRWERIYSISDIPKYTDGRLPYLYFAGNEGIFICVNDDIPSQFFRKIIATRIGIGNQFDWKQNYFLNNVFTTYEKLTGANGKIVEKALVYE